MSIGIIGTGNMGSVLISAFIDSLAITPSQLYITNRTKEKAERLKADYPDLHVMNNASEVVRESNIIFICVKPLDIYPLIQQLKPDLHSNKCIVSITSPITVEELESHAECNVARIIPSITNRALAGVSLITFGEKCSGLYREQLLRMMEKISTPVEIDNSITRVSSDLVSCGPAFLSYLLQRLIDGAVETTDITKDNATLLVSEMMIGFGKLLEKEIYSFRSLQEKVCVKGGVTGEGIKVLEHEVGDMFEKLIKSTHEKYKEDRYYVERQFKND
ncbi:late competence protein ComER [Lottiidibacillus patelloidae]|uniref:Pyrroline-5-carboxylate reductase n=1 Tax=Lottiidibacillus patelloidae TaxID=2670334 RepID=A0A263BWS1_9BACI|nr:late competence protein ComER [Lottiidibacillus patelloidae]OZM57767.1 late competence protein ComER [Lottiidibacillus patelloidae]